MAKINLNRYLAIFLIVCICFFVLFGKKEEVYADSASLVVQGGSIGTGGITDFTSLLGPVSALIGLALASGSIHVNISEASQAAGMTKTQYIQDQIINWKENAPAALSAFCSDFMVGSSIGVDGMIYLTDTACDLVRQFGNWITSNPAENYTPELPVATGSTCVINGYTLFYGHPTINLSGTSYTPSKDVAICLCKYNSSDSSPATLLWCSDSSFTIRNSYGSSASLRHGNYQYFYVRSSSSNISSIPSNIPRIDATYSQILGTGSGVEIGTTDIPDTFYGDDWADFVPGLDIPEGYEGAIDTNILQRLLDQLEEQGKYVISIQDYLDAIQQALNEQAVSVPVQDVNDGTVVVVDLPAPVVLDPTYEQVAPADLPAENEKEDVTDPSVPANPDDVIAPMMLNLTDIFPFCIPFDIYALLQKFVADPVAPSIHIQFTVPIVNADVDYNFSLAPFSTVALILRNVEMALLIVGLAVATRRIYLRG